MKSNIPQHVHDKAMEWFLIMDSNEETAQERDDFKRWHAESDVHKEAYSQAVTLLSAFGTLSNGDLTTENRSKLSFVASSKKWYRKNVNATLAMAASLMIAIVTTFVISDYLNDDNSAKSSDLAKFQETSVYETKVGQKLSFALADGSNLLLGPDSKLTLQLTETSRVANLSKGIARFDVVKDNNRPFTVKADFFSAVVLGTTFTVSFNANTARLSVLEGEVRAEFNHLVEGGAPLLLEKASVTAGSSLSATNESGLSPKRSISTSDFIAWESGRLTYIDATLEEVIADANRYSDKPIRFSSNTQDEKVKKVTLSFDSDEIDKLVELLPRIAPVDVKESEDKIHILKSNS
ncbi:MAG: FecR domain-containing protein [Pseudomonadota bacterium]